MFQTWPTWLKILCHQLQIQISPFQYLEKEKEIMQNLLVDLFNKSKDRFLSDTQSWQSSWNPGSVPSPFGKVGFTKLSICTTVQHIDNPHSYPHIRFIPLCTIFLPFQREKLFPNENGATRQRRRRLDVASRLMSSLSSRASVCTFFAKTGSSDGAAAIQILKELLLRCIAHHRRSHINNGIFYSTFEIRGIIVGWGKIFAQIAEKVPYTRTQVAAQAGSLWRGSVFFLRNPIFSKEP